MQISSRFFQHDACEVAMGLLGKVIRRYVQGHWLAAQIIETEAYYKTEKASHSSLGYTHGRRAMFMPAGTIYMYHARGHPSLNISVGGEGDAVLVKSAYPYEDGMTDANMIAFMQQAYEDQRPPARLCRGQTLLCRSLRLTVAEWNAGQFCKDALYIDDVGIFPGRIIQASRLGIPAGRDTHLPYRFIDYDYARFCTKNPLTSRTLREKTDYRIIESTNPPV